MIHYADIEDAKKAVLRWNGDPESVAHIGDHANSIFQFKNNRGDNQILRLSDPSFRSLSEINAELTFVNHLHADGVKVAPAILTSDNVFAFVLQENSRVFLCSSVTFIEGIDVNENTPYWNFHFFEAWGRNLGLIHESSVRFNPSDGFSRWQWNNEILFRHSEKLIPSDDTESRKVISKIFDQCSKLNTRNTEFGLIHADHAPQNFRYDAERNLVTAFDFGNCCYHWFIADLAISLSLIKKCAEYYDSQSFKQQFLNTDQ